MKRNTLTLIVIACALVVAPFASAQGGAMKGEDNEFGKIRMPYSADMDGERVPITAEVVLHNMYQEKDGRFYMFAFDVQHVPLDVTLDQIVREDTGQELPCYQEQKDDAQVKCFVDGRNMPPENTKILMHGSVGASKTGTFTVGAIVVAFTATWFKIPMSSGLDAELYAGTQMNVHKPTSGSTGLAGVGNKVPAPGTALVVGALGVVAVGLAALRRRS